MRGFVERRASWHRLGERGRRRTRQDQIAPGSKIAGEIAEQRSAPNEEKLFLLPDRLFKKSETLLKIRYSRLTGCLADPLFRRPEPPIKIRFEKQTLLEARVTCRHQT